jgi:Sulfatase
MIRTLKIFVALTLIFVLHRVEAWGVLSEQYSAALRGEFSALWRTAVTGLLSDMWTAALLTAPFWIFEYFPSKRNRALQKNLGLFWVLLFGALTAGHQGYVEFFKFQIIPFHLTYLTDQSFISANGTNMFGTTSCYILALTGIVCFWLRAAPVIRKRKRLTTRLVAFFALASLGHMMNIRWRVNWFVVEPLQANYIESLYSNLGKKPTLKALSSTESTTFVKATGQIGILFARQDVRKMGVSIPSGLHTPEAEAKIDYLAAIQTEVNLHRTHQRPIILGLILAESLRDTDTGKRTLDGESITPHLDKLQEAGVRFTQVYSSGPVTRGGQEATWCGTPSATDTSLMRSFPDVNVKCLPTLFRGSKEVRTVWMHGGDERFDSQVAFWTHQGVSQFVTRSDYPPGTPATGWGISDLALFDKSVEVLDDLSRADGVKTIMPMLLSVTNHIPWTVPSDASIETKNYVAPHPAHKTIKYFDESLDLFVKRMKEKHLWDNSIFILSGDHGNLEVPWQNNYGDDPMKWERFLSHVSVTLTGGIIETLRAEGRLPKTVSQYSAQNQIAPFLAYFALPALGAAGLGPVNDGVFMDAPLFNKSPWPIASDLNQYLFLPEEGLKLAKEKVLAGNIPEAPMRPWIAATRYRAWLEFLYSPQKNLGK